MKMVKDVLVPVNLKPLTTRTMETMQLLQNAFESNIELLHVVPNSRFYNDSDALPEDAIRQKLSDIEAALVGNGVNVAGSKILFGSVAQQIVDYAGKTQKNLILLDRNHTGEDYIDVTIDKVVRKAMCPVWVVNQKGDQSAGINAILCAYDFSENSARAIRNAIILAKAYSSTLYLVHVIEKPYYDWFYKAERAELSKFEGEEIKKAEQFLSQFTFGKVAIQKLFPVGTPRYEIMGKVRALRPDLVVMGTKGQSNLKSLFIGSVSEHVLSKLTVPFLTMRTQNVFELDDQALEMKNDEMIPRAKRLKDAGFIEEALHYLLQHLQMNSRDLGAYEEIIECYELLGDNRKADEYRSRVKHIEDKNWELKVESEVRKNRHKH